MVSSAFPRHPIANAAPKVLSPDRILFVLQRIQNPHSFTFTDFLTLKTSEELHLLASLLTCIDASRKWRDDTILRWIALHARCSEATALMIFWRSSPATHLRHNDHREAAWTETSFRLLHLIRVNFISGRYCLTSIGYDPTNDYGTNHVLNNSDLPNSETIISKKMATPVAGILPKYELILSDLPRLCREGNNVP